MSDLLKKIASSFAQQGDIYTDAEECTEAVASASRLRELARRLGEGVSTELMRTSLYADGVVVCKDASLYIDGSVLPGYLPQSEWDEGKVWQVAFAPGVLVDLDFKWVTDDCYSMIVKDEDFFYDLVMAKERDRQFGPLGKPAEPENDFAATASGLFDAIKQDLDGLFQHGVDGDAIESAYIRAQCGLEAAKAAMSPLRRLTAQECAKQFTNTDPDSSFTWDSLLYRGKEYPLRVYGVGESACFQWVDEDGSALGDGFSEMDAFTRFRFLSFMANERDAIINLPSDKKPSSPGM